jgi:hypothetical protein
MTRHKVVAWNGGGSLHFDGRATDFRTALVEGFLNRAVMKHIIRWVVGFVESMGMVQRGRGARSSCRDRCPVVFEASRNHFVTGRDQKENRRCSVMNAATECNGDINRSDQQSLANVASSGSDKKGAVLMQGMGLVQLGDRAKEYLRRGSAKHATHLVL